MKKELLYIRPNDILSLYVNLESVVDAPEYFQETQEKKNIFGFITQNYEPAGFTYHRFKTLEEFVSYKNGSYWSSTQDTIIIRDNKLIKLCKLVIRYRENNETLTYCYDFETNDEAIAAARRLEILSGLTCVIEKNIV